jgi:hypothetical protein
MIAVLKGGAVFLGVFLGLVVAKPGTTQPSTAPPQLAPAAAVDAATITHPAGSFEVTVTAPATITHTEHSVTISWAAPEPAAKLPAIQEACKCLTR